ncbi:hypothetical protein OMP40_19210 [Cohnella rhizosphaerae]|uniref:Uncharacterized protein n=1 Tax=Cohnella rhizosphaerae TaxID=1457232 RepID=A0A9X4QUC0_9BACL|nr:hypothetical protein [Cohnella rhizosphaerae]MDG0811258.1 hypothetical protein [Cohnella rhizosphaerae]
MTADSPGQQRFVHLHGSFLDRAVRRHPIERTYRREIAGSQLAGQHGLRAAVADDARRPGLQSGQGFQAPQGIALRDRFKPFAQGDGDKDHRDRIEIKHMRRARPEHLILAVQVSDRRAERDQHVHVGEALL